VPHSIVIQKRQVTSITNMHTQQWAFRSSQFQILFNCSICRNWGYHSCLAATETGCEVWSCHIPVGTAHRSPKDAGLDQFSQLSVLPKHV